MSMLVIVLLTYNRIGYAKKTLSSTLDSIKWSGELGVHVATDGDTQDYIEQLFAIAAKRSKVLRLDATNSERRGYGANWNLATQYVHGYADYVLPLEDDWELTRELDADRLCAGLAALGGGCVRLGYLGYTQELRGNFVYANGEHFLHFDPNSPEPHVFAGHPRIETVEYERAIGPWPEDLKPGETEFSVAHWRAARERVYWPLDYVHPHGDMFVHVGTHRSY